MPVDLKVTRATTLFNNDGEYRPGDVLNHVIVVSHNPASTGAAFNLTISDLLTGSTIVGGSINVSPIALNDSYTAIGNTMLVVGKSGNAAAAGSTVEHSSFNGNVLDNDIDVAGGTMSVVANSGATAQGGSFAINADGSFTYISQAGDTGTDTFTYQVTDGSLTSKTATVTITLSGQVWYVDGSKAANSGDGTSANPFGSINSVNTAAGTDTNDFIHVEGTNNGAALVLETGQTLIGDGSALTVGGITISDVAADTQASINSASGGYAVQLGSGNTITGVDLGGAGGALSSGSGFGAATITDMKIDVAGQALNLNGGTGSTLNATFDSVDSDGGNQNIFMSNVDGTVNLGGGALSGATFTGVQISGGNASIDFNGTLAHTGNARAIDIQNKTGSGTVEFDGQVTSSGNSDGINLNNNATSTINFDGGLSINNSTANGGSVGFSANNSGTINITDTVFTANTITTVGGAALNVVNTAIGGGDLTFVSVSANGGVNGIVLNNTGNVGGLTITGAGGNTKDASGGLITGTTQAGIVLNQTRDISLNQVTINGSGDDGISGDNVTNFTLNAGNLTNNGNAQNDSGIDFGNSAISPDSGFTGAIAITNTNVQNSYENNIYLGSSSGTSSFTLTGSTINGNSVNGNDGLLIISKGTADISANVSGNTFTANKGDHFQVALGNDNGVGGDAHINFTGNTLVGGHAQALGQGITIGASGQNPAWNGRLDYNVSGNTINGSISHAITVQMGVSTSTAVANGTIANNFIGTAGTNGSGSLQGNGIDLATNGSGTHTVAVTGNTIRQVYDRGISLLVNDASSSSVTNASFHNNTVVVGTFNLSGSREALYINTGSFDPNFEGKVDAPLVRLDIGGVGLANTFTNGANVTDDIRVRARFDSRVEFEGYGGAANDGAAVQNYLTGRNAGTTSLVTTVAPYSGVGTNGRGDDGLYGYNGNVPMPTAFLVVSMPAPADEEAVVQPVTGTGQPAGPAGPVVVDDGLLSFGELGLIVEAAIARWAAAGATDEQIEAMRQVYFGVEDLGGLKIGESNAGTIILDHNAAGYQWFVDATPDEDSEFAGTGTQLQATNNTGAAGTRIDLLTVVTHELGHQIGLTDTYDVAEGDELMYGTIRVGERRLAGSDDAAGADGSAVPVAAGLTVASGITQLPTYQEVTVTYQSTIDNVPNRPLVNLNGVATATADGGVTASSPAVAGTPVDGLSFGGIVWNDADEDLLLDAGETGIANVQIDLYADDNGDGTLSQTDALIGSTVTDANGSYSFGGLNQGNYMAVVKAVNFDAGGALAGKTTAATAVDPDGVEGAYDVDGDNNAYVSSVWAFTRAVTLSYGGEPGGSNVNNTVDMAFVTPNQAPVIGELSGDTLSYSEGDGAKILDTGTAATLTDADSANFDGGSLTVAFVLGAGESLRAEDALGRDGVALGVAAGEDVLIGGVKIGTVTGGGAGGGALVFTLNDQATAARVQTLLGQITYTNTDTETPDTAARTVEFKLVDGDGTAFTGQDTTAATVTVNITATDDAVVPGDDTADVDEDKTVTIDVLANDTDPDGPAPTIVKVQGVAVVEGDGMGSDGGAIVTLTGGKLVYDPTGPYSMFGWLVDNTSGAVNTSVDDTFTYELSSGEVVTVTVTVNGVASADDELHGDAQDNVITGTANVDQFHLYQGGDDDVDGLGDDDLFFFGGELTAADIVDGGAGFDTILLGDRAFVGLPSNYAETLGATTLTDVEVIAFAAGNDYSLTMHDGNVASGKTMQIDASLVSPDLMLIPEVNTLTFDGSAETDGSFIIFGGDGNDSLTGGEGNDLIDGGLGNDAMTGGKGNDTYEVDDHGDTVTELDGEGTDRVLSSRLTYTLGDHVENLRGMLGIGQTLNGNALSNDIVGGAGADTLNGFGGNDRMQGNDGNDVYVVDSNLDKVIEKDGEGADLVMASVSFSLAGQYVEEIELTGTGNINATGNGLDNRMFGNDGNNRLNGGIGADVMRGGLGNDVYVVDNVGDEVTENDDAGTDRVNSRISYTLGDHVENLYLEGVAEINATGNALRNEIHGNAASNVIDGGAGNDVMIGGKGNDRYIVDHFGETVQEFANEGFDTVDSSVTFSLAGSYVELLRLTGTGDINGSGNGQADTIIGNSGRNVISTSGGDDKLSGGLGNDTLYGGAGADKYVFDTALGADNVDEIVEFSVADDTIYLDRSLFSGVSASGLNASAFHTGTAAHDANDRIIYDSAEGAIFYDADGNGAGEQVLFATITAGTILTAADFIGF